MRLSEKELLLIEYALNWFYLREPKEFDGKDILKLRDKIVKKRLKY